jgi:hypothetical protein
LIEVHARGIFSMRAVHANRSLPASSGLDAALDPTALRRKNKTGLPFALALVLALLGPLFGGLAIAGGWAWYQFGSRTAALAFLRGQSLVLDPQPFDLGAVKQHERRHLTIRAVNLTGQPITIHGVQGYCNHKDGCVLGTDQFPFVLQPRTGHPLNIEYEYRAKPELRPIHLVTEAFTEIGNIEIVLDGRLVTTAAAHDLP